MKTVVGESHNLQKIVECLPHNIVLIASCINVDTREIKVLYMLLALILL